MRPTAAIKSRAALVVTLTCVTVPAGAYVIQVDCLGSGGNPGATSSIAMGLSCDSGGIAPVSTGRAAVDITDQSLRTFASGRIAYGSSYLAEQVTLSGGPTSGTTRVELTLRLDGGFSGPGFSNQALGGSISIASGPTARADYWYSGSGYNIDWQTYSSANNGSFTVTDLSSGFDDIETVLSVVFDLNLAAPTFQLYASLVAWALGEPTTTVDFENTARLSVRLADGLVARTDSGHVIPAAPNATVPEPSGVALLSLALLTALSPQQRRRQARARRRKLEHPTTARNSERARARASASQDAVPDDRPCCLDRGRA